MQMATVGRSRHIITTTTLEVIKLGGLIKFGFTPSGGAKAGPSSRFWISVTDDMTGNGCKSTLGDKKLEGELQRYRG